MNAWPWKNMDDKKKENIIKQKIHDEMKKIAEHFYNDVVGGFSPWIYFNLTNDPALLKGSADIFIKHAYCEKCEHYIGVNPIKRKLYNISVLSGYCKKHEDTTIHDFRCTSIDFDPLWIQVIELQLSKMGIYEYVPDKATLDAVWKKMKERPAILPIEPYC